MKSSRDFSGGNEPEHGAMMSQVRRELVGPTYPQEEIQPNCPIIHLGCAVNATLAQPKRKFLAGSPRRAAAEQRQPPVVLDVPVKAKTRVEHAKPDPKRTPKEDPIVVIDEVPESGDDDDRERARVLECVVQTLWLARVGKLPQTLQQSNRGRYDEHDGNHDTSITALTRGGVYEHHAVSHAANNAF